MMFGSTILEVAIGLLFVYKGLARDAYQRSDRWLVERLDQRATALRRLPDIEPRERQPGSARQAPTRVTRSSISTAIKSFCRSASMRCHPTCWAWRR
jgi:hypothetical protein